MSTRKNSWQFALASFVLAMVAVVIAYRTSYVSLFQKWIGDAAFSHGLLIIPISLWLVWRKRVEIASIEPRASAAGLLLTMACVLAWLVARGSGVLVVEQFAAVGLIPSLVLAGFGWPVTRVLLFPLGFLFFMVPFGRGFVPALMQATADFSTVLLQWSGVPVFRSHMVITIPGGYFQVARACSGLNYLITGLVLGILYAYLSYRGWRKRLVCVAAFVVIPVILNGLRVYITILASHLTDMRFGPGYEHVTFGRIFFVVTMLVLFWVGRRWHDDPVVARPAADSAIRTRGWTSWWPLPLAVLVALAGPPFMQESAERIDAHLADKSHLVVLPAATSPWRGPIDDASAWRPQYRGGIVERNVRYDVDTGTSVDVFVSVYGLGAANGAEMISYRNTVYTDEHSILPPEGRRSIQLGTAGEPLVVREVVVRDGDRARLVWYWFVVGNRPVADNFAAKALEAVLFVTRSAQSERIVVLSTPGGEEAGGRLEALIRAYGQCAARGFQRQWCAP